MKVIIAGSRNINNINYIIDAIQNSHFHITEIVSGGARGVDKLGEEYAKLNKIPIKIFNAEWNTFGKSAGYRRNKEMGDYADALIAIWNGESLGTKHMIDIAKDKNLLVYVYKVNNKDNL